MTAPTELETLLASLVTLLPVDHAAASSLGAPFDLETLAATSTRAAALDELQIDVGDGPAWGAYRTGRTVQADLHDGERTAWPFFSASPLTVGVCSISAFPLGFGPLRIGAVSLYGTTRQELDREQLQLAADLSVLLGRSVVAQALAEAADGTVLRDPALSRREVHQATGMIISQMKATPEDALLALRAYAFGHGVPVRDVAAEILARRLDFSPNTDPDSRK
jgi:hypothetical protein